MDDEERKIRNRKYGQKYRERRKGKDPEGLKQYNRMAQRKRRGHPLSETEYSTMLVAQGGVCAICQKPPSKGILHADHDKKTGRNRGLLCFRCNMGIGFLHHDVARLQKAIEYLQREGRELLLTL